MFIGSFYYIIIKDFDFRGDGTMILNYKEFKAYLDTLTYRPKLMLHSCCAPCSSHVLFLLKDYFEITIFYSNDNIYPYEEYERRLKEEIRFCKEIDSTLQVIFDPYNEEVFLLIKIQNGLMR